MIKLKKKTHTKKKEDFSHTNQTLLYGIILK